MPARRRCLPGRADSPADGNRRAPGDPEAGDPIQYDHIRVEHEQGAVEITVHNRAILLFTTDREAVRRIHQVCCRLDDIATGCRQS